MSEIYKVLSPWAESSMKERQGLAPRLDSLDGKTIGLFAHFKEGSPYLLQEVARQIKTVFRNVSFVPYTYIVDTKEINQDDENYPVFLEWLGKIDGVIAGFGDGGSCAMYLGYNLALIEKAGKPVVMLNSYKFESTGKRGVSARAVPGLRTVVLQKDGIVAPGITDLERWGREYYEEEIKKNLDSIIQGLVEPLSEEEKHPSPLENQEKMKFEGNILEVNNFFYCHGWTTGLPIVPPTKELVNEMIQASGLAGDYVVGELPPRLGKATIEKIAINAVMAGCLPTYMPILVAIVKGMLNPKIHLEGWTCSYSTWAPLIVINGPISRDIHMNTGRTYLSPYNKPAYGWTNVSYC